MSAPLTLLCAFIKNFSQELQSEDAKTGLRVSGTFVGNTALNTGAGSRGGCLRVLNVNASVSLSGLFKDNYSDERGAVFATNWVSEVCVLRIACLFCAELVHFPDGPNKGRRVERHRFPFIILFNLV